jgi:threonine dehydrogenase-like Zn-dependent dehydrogenase
MAARNALLLGTERAIVIDRIPERLALARNAFGLETNDYTAVDSVHEMLLESTGGRGPDFVHRRGRHGGTRHRSAADL